MDSRTQLDHALFQLTPTRTRCDLLVVSKSGTKEKIASGLVEPFLRHLKSASDQISKGGYSFDLFPTANGVVGGNGDFGWFTKGTVERFVRFVATPEILERVVTIEKEIVQIEDEIHRTQEAVASNPEASGENSKHSLLVVLENRQKMLQKEQGMAYARASIVGYDKGHIDDLVAFADSFGALRLREACISFQELCAEKEKDKLWADELAALAACGHSQLSSTQNSGIMLTAENERNISPGQDQTGVSPDTQGMNSTQWNQRQQHVPLGWFNHHPEYMYPFHGPMPANSAPFQGYAYPGMQFVSSYPTHSVNSHRHSREDAASTRDGDVHVSHDNSDSGSESGDGESPDKSHSEKKSSKRSLRKIVVRNINYISKGRHSASSGESSDAEVDEDFLRRKVEDIVGSFEKHQHSNRHHHRNKTDRRHRGISNGSDEAIEKNMEGDEDEGAGKSNTKKSDGWDAFQNILMKEDSDCSQVIDPERAVSYAGDKQKHVDVVDDYCAFKHNDISRLSSSDYHQLDEELAKGRNPNKSDVDPLVQDGRGTMLNGGGHENFENSDSYRRIIRRGQNENEEFLILQRENTMTHSSVNFASAINESSTIKSHRDGDWLVIDEYGRKSYRESGDRLNLEAYLIQGSKNCDSQIEKKIDHVAFDDSIVVPERSFVDEQQHSSLWETDMGIISGLGVSRASQDTSSRTKERVDSHEPDDLMMMLGRDSEVEQATRSWSPPDVDFAADFSHTIPIEKNSSVEQDTAVNDKLPSVKSKVNGKLTENDKKPKPIRGSLTRSKTEVLPRNKKLTNMSKEAIQITKAKQEEANRKRLEELMIERQKRIAERSGKSSITAICKQVTPDVKKVGQLNTRETKSVTKKV